MKKLKLKGKDFVFKELNAKQTIKLIPILKNIFSATQNENEDIDILELLTNSFDSIIQLLALIFDEEEKFLEELSIDELTDLITGVIEANQDALKNLKSSLLKVTNSIVKISKNQEKKTAKK